VRRPKQVVLADDVGGVFSLHNDAPVKLFDATASTIQIGTLAFASGRSPAKL
jgi:hypothetical protein